MESSELVRRTSLSRIEDRRRVVKFGAAARPKTLEFPNTWRGKAEDKRRIDGWRDLVGD